MNILSIFYIFVQVINAQDPEEYCNSQIWNVTNVPSSPFNYNEICDTYQPFNQTSLTIECSTWNKATMLAIEFESSFTVQNFSTNCGSLLIRATNISIDNIQASSELTYEIPNILSTYLITLESTTNDIYLNQIFNGENYTLTLYSYENVNTNNFLFIGQQLFIIANKSIYLSNSNYSISMRSCNNTFGYDNVINSAKDQWIQEIRNIFQLFGNNEFYNFTKLQTLFIVSNYTGALISKQKIVLQQTKIRASQLALYSSFTNSSTVEIDQDSILDLNGTGCAANQGDARGPAFFSPYLNCSANGGSNGGYGGVGQNPIDKFQNSLCLQLTNSTRYMFNLYPYGYRVDNLFQGSGGSTIAFNPVNTNQGTGGGAILIKATIIQLYGQISANGQDGGTQSSIIQNDDFTSIGAGAGGTINILFETIQGPNSNYITANGGGVSSSNNSIGEGGGGLIKLKRLTDWDAVVKEQQNVSKLFSSNDLNLGYFQVKNGPRDFDNQSDYQNYIAHNGSILLPWCPPYHEINFTNLNCSVCRNGYYKLWWSGQCVPCPSTTSKGTNYQEYKDNGTYYFCPYIESCSNQKCCLIDDFNLNLLRNTGIQLLFFTIFIIIGIFLRRHYKKRESCSTEKNFDFELATREIMAETIITESLMENPVFQFGDLLYHAHRIHVIGCNTYNSPWMVHQEPTIEIEHAVVKEEYFKFANRFNKIALWKKGEYILLSILAILYYPLYWHMQTKYKKKKFKALNQFMTKNEICKFWRTNTNDQNFIRLKMTKSADYTLLYIDVFNYKNSDLKYVFLTCPYIIYLSGEGNFLRPFYICESDQFLASLFFATNKKITNTYGNRQKIMDNLVGKEEREENSKEIRRFLKKFNKISMTLDYGAASEDFIYNFKELYKVLDKWNQNFFKIHSVKLEMIVTQIPFDPHQSAIINVIQYKSDSKLTKFLTDVHKSVNYKKILDVKFGLFIFNVDQDPQDIDDQLQNQKFSFYDNEEFSMNIDQIEYVEESNFELNQLKEQFLQKNMNKDQQTQQHVQHQFKQIIEKHQSHTNQFKKSFQMFDRAIEYIRYQMFSHKTTILDKYVIIILVGILILLDNFFLQSTISIMIQLPEENQKVSFVEYQLLLIPYPFVIILSNIFESIWIPSQSYGIIKLYLIFNAMAIVQYFINFIIMLVQLAKEEFCVLDAFSLASLLLKILLNQLSQRLISMNTKLNQLSNSKQ